MSWRWRTCSNWRQFLCAELGVAIINKLQVGAKDEIFFTKLDLKS